MHIFINFHFFFYLLVYETESTLIPKNTSVIVARVPVANTKKAWNNNKSDTKKANVSSNLFSLLMETFFKFLFLFKY